MAYFTNIDKIKYEGSDSTNPFAFKFYNPEEIIGGKNNGRVFTVWGGLLAYVH